MTLDASGHWTFTLVNPIDQVPSPINDSGPGPETATTLDLSGLITAVEFDGETAALSGDVKVTVIDDSLQLTSGTSSGTVDEGALTFSSATGSGDQFGSGTDVGESGAVVTASGSVSGFVNFGADGPDGVGGVAYNGTSTNPFQFTVGTASDLAAAFNAANPGITSHGETITSITDNAGTLTASTADHVVFTMTLDASGHWTFTLVNPIDQAPSPINDSGPGPETATTLDLSGLITAVEFDGETAALSGDVKVTVIDDSLQLTSGTSSGTVDEGALTFSSATGSGDQFGSGTDVGESGAVVTASGSLSGLVNFGADGPDGVGGVAYNGTSTNPFQFTVGTASDLAAAFNAANPGITSHGETITSITDNAGTLTASTADHVVFTMTLDASGHWTFTLVNPIDQAPSPINDAGGPETPTTLDLSGLITAVEFDGETAALSGDVKVTVIDDSVQLTSGTSSGTVDEGALTFSSATGSGDQFGSGTGVGESGAVVTASGSLSGLVNFGADGQDGVGGVAYNGTSTNPFQFTVGTASDLAAAFNAANPGITSHGETITSITDNAGTLTASTADHVVFTMTLDASGHWTFTLVNPIDQAPSPINDAGGPET